MTDTCWSGLRRRKGVTREDKHTKHRIRQQIILTHSLFEEDSVLSKNKRRRRRRDENVGTFNLRNGMFFMVTLL